MGNAVLKNSLEGVTNSSKILQKAGLYVQALESSGIDITTGYDEWLSIGFALSSLGESGRDLYHRVSQFHPDYDHTDCDKKFDNFLQTGNGSVTLGTFFQKCHDQGINPKLTEIVKLGIQ